MALLLTAQQISKTFGAVPLFENVSIALSDGDRLGLIGPNGSGKSTLLQILAGVIAPDSGTVSYRKNVRVAFVAQDSIFPDVAIRTVIETALKGARVPEVEWSARLAETLGRAGFVDFEVHTGTLSGGWKKRLAIAEALVSDPDLLLLDEPTNHLDLEAIEWVESLLKTSRFASVTVSHDRYVLENVATSVAELNRAYPDGLLLAKGRYSDFLERKDQFLSAQSKHMEALENRVRTEIEWLRRGPKARATKAKARIDKAHSLIGELKDLQSRTKTDFAGIDFTASDRKTKRLIECTGVSFSYEDRPICRDLSVTVTNGMRLGIVGPNGSGKTTLLRLFRGEIAPAAGEIRRADNLKIVYFDQNRPLNSELTLRRALAPDSDSVNFRNQTIHVAAWASRFLFKADQLDQPVSRLSGGEKARVLVANLMLETADILLLDEPTNDLDIPTLELLEENLLEFTGALILITHDRHMLDRVSTSVLGLDGAGRIQQFADYRQWEEWRVETETAKREKPTESARKEPQQQRKKLSYLDARDMETIEDRIAAAEAELAAKKTALEDNAVVTDPNRLQTALADIETAQQVVDKLYERWSELETKLSLT